MKKNYIKILGSFYISYFFKKYRNLNLNNQQVWEGLNFKITDLFIIILREELYEINYTLRLLER